MTARELEALRGQTVTDLAVAADLLGIRRTLSYRLARERGELCEGVRLIRVGSLWKCPVRPLLAVLGLEEGESRDHQTA